MRLKVLPSTIAASLALCGEVVIDPVENRGPIAATTASATC
jgi:hypothetical protein